MIHFVLYRVGVVRKGRNCLHTLTLSISLARAGTFKIQCNVPFEHENGEHGRGDNLELVQELKAGTVEVADGQVFEVVLDHIKARRHGHVNQVDRLLPYVFLEGLGQMPNAAVLLERRERQRREERRREDPISTSATLKRDAVIVRTVPGIVASRLAKSNGGETFEAAKQ